MRLAQTPHAVHLFFCTHTREDGSQSCGHNAITKDMAEELKKRFKAQGMPVRITRTGCLGPCAQGPNAMAYPQKKWFQALESQDVDAVETEIKNLLTGE